MGTFEERKINIQKIFEGREVYLSLYNRSLSATTDEDLTKIVTDYKSDSINSMTFEERKTYNSNYNASKKACISGSEKTQNANNDTELAQNMADNYRWLRKIK